MPSFADKVRESRELINIPQSELANLVGVSRRTITAYETGEKMPRESTLKKLASVFGVSVDYLIKDEIDDPTYGIEKEPYVDETQARFSAKAAREIDFLMERNNALFAGGAVSQEMKDAYFESVMSAYLECKEKARAKFGRHEA